jgi:signal transduction histidine kinase
VLNILIAVLVGHGVYKSWSHFKLVQSLKHSAVTVNALYDVNRNLSLERGSSLSVAYAQPEYVELLQQELMRNRRAVDNALSLALAHLKDDNSTGLVPIQDKYQALIQQRIEIDSLLLQPMGKRKFTVVNHFFEVTRALVVETQNFILFYSRAYSGIDASISRQMMFKYFVWELAEYSGEEYSIIGKMIADDKYPTPEQKDQLASLRGHIQYGWEILHKFSVGDEMTTEIVPFMEEAQTQYFFTFDQTKDLFYDDHLAGEDASYPISIELWLGMAGQAVDSLLTLQDEIVKSISQQVGAIEARATREIIVSISIFLCAIMLSLYCWSIIAFRVARPINTMVNALYRATQENVFEMPKIFYRHDEIGKLARVLETFQLNAQKMKQSNEELERFAFIAAHDLKSPLRAVDNISQWLEEDLADTLPEKSKKHLEEMRKRVGLMDKLLDDTLEYARINAKMEITSNEFVSGQLIMEEIIALLAPPAGFAVNVSDRFSKVQLKKFPIQQVLYNLINNAIKHHDKDRGIVDVDLQEDDTEYVIFINDDGPGIDPMYHQKIFEMFQTLQPRDKSRGRGMGLAMARKIVITQGGNITIESEPGNGALFRFTWPKSTSDMAG